VLQYFGEEVGREALRLYPRSAYPTPIAAMVDLFSDNIFKCPSKFMADALSRHGVKSFFYAFNHLPSFSTQSCLGVAHSFELPFIFPSLLPAFTKNPLTPQEVELSHFMRTSWSGFARDNTPNNSSGSLWPGFEPRTSDFIVLDEPLSQGSHLLDTKCPFWRKHICGIGTPHCT